MSFYVEAKIELVGEDQRPLARSDVEVIASVLMEALAGKPGDLDVAADLGTSELTICGFFDAPSPRAAIDQADDVISAVARGLGAQVLELASVSARPADQLLNA